MKKEKTKGGSGVKILIGVIAYIVVFVAFMIFSSSATSNNIMEIKTMEDLEYAYQNGAYGRIEIGEFIELGKVTTISYETVTKGNTKVKEKRYHTTTMRGADFDTGYVLLMDYYSTDIEKFKDDPKAFVKIKKIKDYEFQQPPLGGQVSKDDYVIGYTTEFGSQLGNGLMFVIISVVVAAIGVSIKKKRSRY